ncbi:heavy metal translocating P-type ATPase [Actinomycetaceae bacterium TAE3-ERU4]|nr:heavy metal translocating P-type ATPase [Actinomycetaceae bacterium TAE3-ERU4]
MIKELLSGAIGIDLLAIVAICVTTAVSQYWAALVVCLMLSGGEALEEYVARRAQRELTSLLEGAPKNAHVPQGKSYRTIPVDKVEIGQTLIVLPGELIPIDGILRSPQAVIDESSLTGETFPVTHNMGDELKSGTVNTTSVIKLEATALARHSQYQSIVRMVKAAQESKAPVVRLADRVSVPFTIYSLLLAGAVWLVTGEPIRAAQVLVVATPCPLLLAAPVAFLAGMNRAAGKGIIVKDSGTLEKLSKISSIAFDKTGTLTYGKPFITEIKLEENKFVTTERQLLQIAASIEAYSKHPLAKAITQAAKNSGIKPLPAKTIRELPGSGMSGVIEKYSQVIRVGRPQWVKKEISSPQNLPTAEQYSQIQVGISCGGQFLGIIKLQDETRRETTQTLTYLKAMEIENLTMLTGDRLENAREIAAEIGIKDIRAELTPAGKVKQLQNLKSPTLFIGDGLNDAPVLAAAEVGIALGQSGVAAAAESADVVIMNDNLFSVVHALQIGKETMRVAKEAIGIGIGLSVFLMFIGATGIMPTIIGALAQEIIDLVCILWALKANRKHSNDLQVQKIPFPTSLA